MWVAVLRTGRVAAVSFSCHVWATFASDFIAFPSNTTLVGIILTTAVPWIITDISASKPGSSVLVIDIVMAPTTVGSATSVVTSSNVKAVIASLVLAALIHCAN